jgi:hypothetical protein
MSCHMITKKNRLTFEEVCRLVEETHSQIGDSFGYAAGHISGLAERHWYECTARVEDLLILKVDPDVNRGGHTHNDFRLAYPGETIREIASEFLDRQSKHTNDRLCPDRVIALCSDVKNNKSIGHIFLEENPNSSGSFILIDGLHRSVAIALASMPELSIDVIAGFTQP